MGTPKINASQSHFISSPNLLLLTSFSQEGLEIMLYLLITIDTPVKIPANASPFDSIDKLSSLAWTQNSFQTGLSLGSLSPSVPYCAAGEHLKQIHFSL